MIPVRPEDWNGTNVIVFIVKAVIGSYEKLKRVKIVFVEHTGH
jgi:hypothetical protein